MFTTPQGPSSPLSHRAGSRDLCSVPGGLIALSLHDGISARSPRWIPEKDDGGGGQGRMGMPMWSGNISGPLSLHLPFDPAQRSFKNLPLVQSLHAVTPPLCLDLQRLTSPQERKALSRTRRSKGPYVSVYPPPGWLGPGYHRPREWRWEAQAVPRVETSVG